MDADAVEIRALGCLIEKQRTTPDVYPLSLNALRLACNQSTNRDPVVDYDEREIHAALERLDRKRWARLASGAGSRAAKYRHLLDEALGLDGAELSLLGALMLRGAQTPGELKQRSERLHAFSSTADVEATLQHLADRGLVRRLERRPGQKEERWLQLLGGEESLAAPPAAAAPAPAPGRLEERVAALEREVAALRTTTEGSEIIEPETANALVSELQEAWNAHDMRRFAGRFAEDADCVNVLGTWWHGRDQIEREHVAVHETIFRESMLELDPPHVRELGSGAAVAHVTWRMTGGTLPGGPAGPRRGVWSLVLRRRDATIEIVAAHNTDTVEPAT